MDLEHQEGVEGVMVLLEEVEVLHGEVEEAVEVLLGAVEEAVEALLGEVMLLGEGEEVGEEEVLLGEVGEEVVVVEQKRLL